MGDFNTHHENHLLSNPTDSMGKDFMANVQANKPKQAPEMQLVISRVRLIRKWAASGWLDWARGPSLERGANHKSCNELNTSLVFTTFRRTAEQTVAEGIKLGYYQHRSERSGKKPVKVKHCFKSHRLGHVRARCGQRQMPSQDLEVIELWRTARREVRVLQNAKQACQRCTTSQTCVTGPATTNNSCWSWKKDDRDPRKMRTSKAMVNCQRLKAN